MKPASLLQKIITTFTTLGRNSIPLGAFWFGGNSAETAMVLYFLETIIAILLAAWIVRLRAPAEDPGYQTLVSTQTEVKVNGRVTRTFQPGNRRRLLEGFLIFSLAFGVAPGIFLAIFLFGILKAEISLAVILSGLGGILVFQLIHFFMDLFRQREMSPEGANAIITASMGRSAIVFLSCFAGVFLAAFVNNWFVIPFAILKTVTDIGSLFKK